MSSSKYRLLNCLDLQKKNIIGGNDNMVRYYLHISQCQFYKESESGECDKPNLYVMYFYIIIKILVSNTIVNYTIVLTFDGSLNNVIFRKIMDIKMTHEGFKVSGICCRVSNGLLYVKKCIYIPLRK